MRNAMWMHLGRAAAVGLALAVFAVAQPDVWAKQRPGLEPKTRLRVNKAGQTVRVREFFRTNKQGQQVLHRRVFSVQGQNGKWMPQRVDRFRGTKKGPVLMRRQTNFVLNKKGNRYSPTTTRHFGTGKNGKTFVRRLDAITHQSKRGNVSRTSQVFRLNRKGHRVLTRHAVSTKEPGKAYRPKRIETGFRKMNRELVATTVRQNFAPRPKEPKKKGSRVFPRTVTHKAVGPGGELYTRRVDSIKAGKTGTFRRTSRVFGLDANGNRVLKSRVVSVKRPGKGWVPRSVEQFNRPASRRVTGTSPGSGSGGGGDKGPKGPKPRNKAIPLDPWARNYLAGKK